MRTRREPADGTSALRRPALQRLLLIHARVSGANDRAAGEVRFVWHLNPAGWQQEQRLFDEVKAFVAEHGMKLEN